MYANVVSAFSAGIGGMEREMQLHPLAALQLLVVRVKLIKTVIVFPAPLLVQHASRNYLQSRLSALLL